MKTVDVVTEIIILCSRERVASFASDPDNATKWYVNIKSVEWKTAKLLKIGSQIAFKAQFLGKQLSYIYEIIEYLPGNKLVMRTADGPFPMETVYVWESINDKTTRMILRNHGTPTGFSKWFSPLMSAMMRRANNKDLKKIKSLLEQEC